MKRPKKPTAITPPSDDPAAAVAAQAEASRQEAWHADKENRWNQAALKPWSRERESLFVRITDLDEASSGLDTVPVIIERLKAKDASLGIEQVLDPHQFIEQAALVLYLASHEPEQWDHLRGRPSAFLRAANAWAEESIPLGSEWAAIHQAVKMRTAHRQMIAIRRPSGSSGGHSGN